MNNKIDCILVFIILLVAIISVAGVVTASDWPMFHHDLLHTGYSTSTAPNTNNVLWTYTTGSGVYSSPAVVDGKVYIGSYDGHVYCLDAEDGDKIWNSSNVGTVWHSSPAVADGRVYIGGGVLYCLNAENGSRIWSYQGGLNMVSSPAVVDDRVYIGTWNGLICCLDADPDDNGDGMINHNPYDEIDDDNDEGYNDSFLADYDLIWIYQTGSVIFSSPAVYLNPIGRRADKVYISSWDRKVYCLYANNGIEIWNYTTQGDVVSSPAVAYGKVYIGSLNPDNKVYCLDAETGLPAWDMPFETDGSVDSSPAIADGKVYIGSYDNTIYCLDANNGTKIWEYETEGKIDHSSPAIADGRIYIGSLDNKVYCFGDIPDTNEAPRRPSRPIGPAEGEVNAEYKFSTTTTDPDGDQIYYWFDWGDGSDSGWVYTPNAIHSWTAVGDYEVTVKAKDIHNAESEWSNPSTVSIVEQTSEESEPKGWIFGSVYNAEGEHIEAASVCVQVSDDKKECTATDEEGHYQIYVQIGDYIVEVKKEGYVTQTKTVTVLDKQAFNLDFTLEEPEDIQIPDENIILIENAISQGNVGGTITFVEEVEEIYYTTSLYITEVDLIVTEITENKISLIVSADETVPGNTIIIKIYEKVFSSDDFEIALDGESIPEADNITDILYAHDDGPFAEWYILKNPNGGELIFLSFSHFSEHTITISSVVEAISILTAIMLFISITIVAILIFIVPVYHFYFKKVKE